MTDLLVRYIYTLRLGEKVGVVIWTGQLLLLRKRMRFFGGLSELLAKALAVIWLKEKRERSKHQISCT